MSEPTVEGMERRSTRAAHAAVAGVIGAACMTVIRSAARHAGLIEKTVPQAIEETLTSAARSAPPEAPHRAIDQLMHLGYGAVMGALAAPLVPRHRSLPARAIGLGVGTWMVGAILVVPLLGAGPSAWRRSATENAVDLAAHLGFGFATELVRGDFHRHEAHRDTSLGERRRARLG